MNSFAIARSWFFALVTCLSLLGFSGEAWAQPTSTATSLVDTRSMHFVSYWLHANDALITPRARRHIVAGTVRPSFSSTLHPIRYQLIDAADRDKIVSPLDLLCLSRAHESLILMCPASAASPKRSVPITGSICRHRRTLPAILPEGCAHPYVVTIEGRTVEVRYATLNAAHHLAPDRGPMPSVDTPSVQTNVLPPPSVDSSPPSTTIELAHVRRTNQLERQNQWLREQNHELQAKQNSGVTSIIITLLCLVFFLIVRAWRSSAVLPSQSVPKPPDLAIPTGKNPQDYDGECQRLQLELDGLTRLNESSRAHIARLEKAAEARANDSDSSMSIASASMQENIQLRSDLQEANQTIVEQRERIQGLENKLRFAVEKLSTYGLRLPSEAPPKPTTAPPPPRLAMPPGPMPGMSRVTHMHGGSPPPAHPAPAASSIRHSSLTASEAARIPPQETTDRFASPPPNSPAALTFEDLNEGIDDIAPREPPARTTLEGVQAGCGNRGAADMFDDLPAVAHRKPRTDLSVITEEPTKRQSYPEYPSKELKQEATPPPGLNPFRAETVQMDVQTLQRQIQESVVPSELPDAPKAPAEGAAVAASENVLQQLAVAHNLPFNDFGTSTPPVALSPDIDKD